MQPLPSHRGDLSQDSVGAGAHPTTVIDPAARTSKKAYDVLSASSVGLEMGVAVMIGLAVGTAMDRWLGTGPWLLFLWLVFGLAAGFRGVLRAVKRADRAAEREIVWRNPGRQGEAAEGSGSAQAISPEIEAHGGR